MPYEHQTALRQEIGEIDGMMTAFEVRDIRFGISKNPVRHWYGNDQPTTALADAFSLMLPIGERFFILSLRRYESRISDPALQAALRDFSRQEAFHTREHEDYNQGLRALGYDVDGMEALLAKRLKGTTKPLHRLAVTCAIEHLTTAFAATLLANPNILDAAPPAYARLWRWHALEELEHRAVAIDVLNTVTASMPGWKRYALRIVVFNKTLANLIAVLKANVCSMARQDGVKLGPAYLARTLWRLFGRPGMARKGFWRLMSYYKPGFDPAREHDPAFVQMWQARIAQENEQAP